MSSPLADLLGKHLQRTHTSVNRLAILSGVPQRTIANWLNGYVRKPHQWQSIARVALALHLTKTETNALLFAGGHPPLSELLSGVVIHSDRTILENFQLPDSHIQYSPFLVIPDLQTFAGRSLELEELTRTLSNEGRAIVCGVRGMGGVGKTTLATRLAYRLRSDFSDGVLWARLDTSDSLSILSAFAEAYGKDVSYYKDVESRASVVRNLLASKRTLIILDNAETSEQVRPLLPPSAGTCAVLITTRHDLSILDGCKQKILEPFDAVKGESVQLFEQYLGQEFVFEYRAFLVEISTIVGHLPMALAIIAGWLANSMSYRLESNYDSNSVVPLLDLLRTSNDRLSLLKRDDQEVRLSFDISYLALSTFQQELFSVLGIFSGEDFGLEAVAYLVDKSRAEVEAGLNRLRSLSLIQESHVQRWRLHPLLKDYAREKLNSCDRLGSSVERFLLMYRRIAQGECSFAGSLDTELPNIRFAVDQAFMLHLYQPLIETVQLIFPTLFNGAWYPLGQSVLAQALKAARALGDRKAEIYFIKGLSLLQLGLGNTRSAQENLDNSLRLAQSENYEEDVADILIQLGKLEHDIGHRRQAQTYFTRSLALARKIKSSNLIGRNLNNLATGLMADARYEEAEKMLCEALGISRVPENGVSAHRILTNLGEIFWCLRDIEQANAFWQEALALARAGAYRAGTAALLSSIAGYHAVREDWVEAMKLSEDAIRLAMEIQSPRVESIARSELGDILRKQNKLDAALEQLIKAEQLAIEANDLERQGIVLRYQGLLYFDYGRLEQASTALTTALEVAKKIDHRMMIADTYSLQAKVLVASGRHEDAKLLVGEGLGIYQNLGLTQQADELLTWTKTLT